MDIADAFIMARSLMDEHGLQDWKLKLDRAKKRFGQCSYGDKTISLSAYLVGLNDEPHVKETVLHEIAHAKCGSNHGHDFVWRNTARSIGATGDRCYDSNEVTTPRGNWVGVCPNGHRTRPRHRRSYKGSCIKCSETFDTRYRFTWHKEEGNEG